MKIDVGFVAIDSQEVDRLVQFWTALLGVAVADSIGDGQFVVLDPTARE